MSLLSSFLCLRFSVNIIVLISRTPQLQAHSLIAICIIIIIVIIIDDNHILRRIFRTNLQYSISF